MSRAFLLRDIRVTVTECSSTNLQTEVYRIGMHKTSIRLTAGTQDNWSPTVGHLDYSSPMDTSTTTPDLPNMF